MKKHIQEIEKGKKIMREELTKERKEIILAGIFTLFPFYSIALVCVPIFFGRVPKNIESLMVHIPFVIEMIFIILGICLYLKNIKSKKSLMFIGAIVFYIIMVIYLYTIYAKDIGHGISGEAFLAELLLFFIEATNYIAFIVFFIVKSIKWILNKYSILYTLKNILIASLLSILIYKFCLLINTEPVKESKLHTLNEFKQELSNRGFYISSSETKFYGIDDEKNSKILDKNIDENEKYPLFIYTGYKTNFYYSNTSSEWLIYYVNGQIYALTGENDNDSIDWCYVDSIDSTIKYKNIVVTEKKDFYTYDDTKGYYKKGKRISPGLSTMSLNNKDYYINIPKVLSNMYEGVLSKNIIVEKVDSKTLKSVSKQYINNNYCY